MEEATVFVKKIFGKSSVLQLKNALDRPGLQVLSIMPGMATLRYDSQSVTMAEIEASFRKLGFEFIKDKESQIVVEIKLLAQKLIKNIESGEFQGKKSDFISKGIGYNYPYLSRLFSRKEGNSIEQYIIQHKIKRVEELLLSGQYSLSEIAYRLGYCSVQYLSTQFRKTTGITVSRFRERMDKSGTSLT